MRLAQVTGTTGSGIVSEIHESPSVEELQNFLDARQIEARAIEALSSWVTVGTVFDGENFVAPEPPEVVEPEPITPEPASLQDVVSQLDSLRHQSIDEYIGQWGADSKEHLWPLLDSEILRALNEDPEQFDSIEAYPSLTGFLRGRGVLSPTPAHVLGVAQSLRQNKIAHAEFLSKTESVRNLLRDEYAALTDEDKLTWSAQSRWAETYGA
jgi:hypothetical protein